ncbi:uncharacterized protein LOC114411277 [Glycine soja]|uniref:uncharacterized protein LOC114411277 n=1 Tax=Glycine soja TaxID=3848 RepID=UPI001040292E|nr:uncharacterized protein LOC114411277 [Glycine soja]
MSEREWSDSSSGSSRAAHLHLAQIPSQGCIIGLPVPMDLASDDRIWSIYVKSEEYRDCHKNLEVQVGQLAKQLADRPSSNFSANTEKNPKEECKVVMTRSRMATHVDEGKVEKKVEEHKQQLAAEPALEPVSDLVELEEVVEDEDDQQERETPIKESKEVPYPLVPSKKDKERHLAKFLDIFKKLEITLPFGEALQQMPLYAKFLKDMLTKKNQYIHSDTIVVEGNFSVVIQHILPPKHKDPRSVTILCSIGEVAVRKALINLGASINLMPLSMCRRLGELEIMPTRMTLQLADCSFIRPYGVIEDVLVRVKHLIFSADFIVMDIEEDVEIPLILGRPFMSTASCVVNMGKKKLQMAIEDQQISFDLFHEEKALPDQNVCLKVNVMDEKRLEKKVLEVGTLLDPG